jgi:hypothetical protein
LIEIEVVLPLGITAVFTGNFRFFKQEVKMKKFSIAGFCLASLALVAKGAEESATIAYYDFKDGTAGSSVFTVKNVVNPQEYTGTAAPSVTTPAGTQPIFTDARPGKYIWAGRGSKELLTENPQSIQFYPATNANNVAETGTGGYVSLESLATAMSALDEGTLEFFGLVDNFLTWKNFVFFNAGQDFKICTSASVNKFTFQNFWQYNLDDSFLHTEWKNATGEWLHFAVTWSKSDNRAQCFLNYQMVGDIFLTNTTTTASRPVILGASKNMNNECLEGRVSCLRVSSKKLTLDEMLLATNYDRISGVLGFWDFSDGEAGEEVNVITNRVDEKTMQGVAGTYNNGTPVTFAEDVPGPYILKSLSDPVVISQNHKSIHFTGDASDSTKGGYIALKDMGTTIAKSPAWTIEFFARRSSSSTALWRTPLSMNISSGSYNQPMKVSLPAQSALAVNLQEQKFSLGFKSEVCVTLPDTTLWTHYAITYSNNEARLFVNYALAGQDREHHKEYVTNWVDGVVDGEVASVTTNKIYAYSDYVSMTNSISPAIADVFLGKGFQATSGYEQFNGDISCVRVSDSVLSPEEFMVATLANPGDKSITRDENTLFHWRGEGEDGAEVEAELAYPLGLMHFSGLSLAAYSGGSKCRYSTSAINPRRPVVWYGEKRKTKYENTSCLEFFGLDGISHVRDWDGSVLQTSMSQSASAHPASWTMEGFIKARIHNTTYHSSLIFGKGAKDNDFCWKLAVSGGYTGFTFRYYVVDENLANQSRSFNFSKNIKDDKWHHVAVSYDAGTKTFNVYFDYELAATQTDVLPLFEQKEYYYRAGRYCNEHGFTGWMDEIRFSNRVLAPDEFIRLMPVEGLTVILR